MTTTLSYLPRGNKGTVQTLRLMARYCRRDAASTQLRAIAHQIIGNVAGHDFNSEIRALFSFTRDQITYRKDPMEVERVQDAVRTLQFGSGDCDDKVTLLVTLLAVCGHRARFCVSGKAPGNWTHVYCEVMTPQGWIPLDPTPEASQQGWETSAPAKGIFEIWPALSANIRVVRAAKPAKRRPSTPILARQDRRITTECQCEQGLGADTYEWKMNKGSGECELKKKSCGFFCKIGKGLKTVAKVGISVAGAVAAPFTGGLSLAATAAIGGGIAAAQNIAAKYMANAPAGSNVEEPKGECAAWLAKKQQEENERAAAAAEAAAAAAKAQQDALIKSEAQKLAAEKESKQSSGGAGLLSQPLVIGALVLGGMMLMSRR